MNKIFSYGAAAMLAGCLLLQSCGNHESGTAGPDMPDPPTVQVPDFNSDTAYAYVAAQLSFGPRTPGSLAQRQCADWMQQKMKSFCDTVYHQETTVKGGDGKVLPCINLVGVINPGASRRILLLTHWDSRPWADQDTKDQDKPVPGADDGGSGVAVLLELLRQLQSQRPSKDLGVDILMTDVEDYGKTEWGENSYCLGTQYWARNPHVPGYKAQFGILLDMVGARGATFPMEKGSAEYAADVQKNVYSAAARAGYSSYFPFMKGVAVTDDHKFVNELAHIPTIDIINTSNNTSTGFKPHWHTHQDNMDVIDRTTLKAVGQSLLQVICEYAAQPWE